MATYEDRQLASVRVCFFPVHATFVTAVEDLVPDLLPLLTPIKGPSTGLTDFAR